MRAAVAAVVLVLGCGGNKDAATAPADDCERFAEKSKPVMIELLKAAGKQMPAAEVVNGLRDQCTTGRAQKKIDPIIGCVLLALDDAGVRTCYEDAFKAYAGAATP